MILVLLMDELFFDSTPFWVAEHSLAIQENHYKIRFSEEYFHPKVDHMDWLTKYNEIVFFQLFRMRKETFLKLLDVVLEKDDHHLIKKKYIGGNVPFSPEKSLLIFLWYMAHNDPLISIADRFGIVSSSVMQVVNMLLYITWRLKYQYINWPSTSDEIKSIQDGFTTFPGVIGAIDGTHVNLKVPVQQQDSYIDRFQRHSINITAICTAEKIFTYVFVGFPGSAHDSRVLSHSSLYKDIERNGKNKYFPQEDCHILGDSAYPLRTWLMVPFKGQNLTRQQRHFNWCLSSSRVNVENSFSFLKSRWARLSFINTYNISKGVEISLAACVLQNFCLINGDEWEERDLTDEPYADNFAEDDQLQHLMGEVKRNKLVDELWQNNH